MRFEFYSGFANRIQPILEAQVQGPYRTAHHAFASYVLLAPATDDEPVIITANRQLRLHGCESKTLSGLDDKIIFAIVFSWGESVVLLDLSSDPARYVLAERTINNFQHSKAFPPLQYTDEMRLQRARREVLDTLLNLAGKAARVQAQISRRSGAT